MQDLKHIFRIIDANFNRSREGLRVCEDIARFALNSPRMSRELKSVRHDITGMMKVGVPGRGGLYVSRDSEGDVGRCSKMPSEMRRLCLDDIFIANAQRVKESLRVLEELFKLIDKAASIKFAALRFKIYNIERRAVKKALKVK